MGAAGANTAPSRPFARLTASAREAPGAGLIVAGLTVIDRACKQLDRLGYDVTIVSDGSCPIPQGLPASFKVVSAADGTDEGVSVGADVVRPHSGDLEGGLRVVDEGTRRRAEDEIFAQLLRGDLGFVARHLNKPLSFFLTRRVLCHWPITPNQVTVVAGLIGLLGAAFIASGDRWVMLAGFLLAHAQSVLDGCDGELARVRFQQSAIGEWLDTLVDDGLNLALFVAVGVGLARATGARAYAVIGWTAAAMMLFYNMVAYRELLRQGEGGEVLKIKWWFTKGGSLKHRYGQTKRPTLVSVLMAMGRRDFFLFAWVVFAAVGWMRVVALYIMVLAAASFFAAAGQVATRRRAVV